MMHNSLACSRKNMFDLERVVFSDLVLRCDETLSPGMRDFLASGGLDSQSSEVPSTAVPDHVIPLRDVLSKVTSQVLPCSAHHSFHNVNKIIINLDTMVHSYFSEFESLWHLAKVVMDPQEQAINVVDVEVEILEKLPPRKTPKKRRAKKPRGPLDVSFPPS
jgi:hypothetical protein